MGRPLKPDTRRLLVLRVRVNAAEKSQIEANASNAGRTPSDFLRGLAISAKPERKVPTPDRTHLLKALAEINKLGSNYNQVARALNRRHGSIDLIGFDMEGMNAAHHGIATLTRHLMDLLG